MACYHPIPAWRTTGGEGIKGAPYRTGQRVQLGRPAPDSQPLQLPCGTCLGCRSTRAQHWSLRCRLEAAHHIHTSIATLTYDEQALPPTLQKRALQLWMKRLRQETKKRIRYFACGEYGERFGRPHYHAILFGIREDSRAIQGTWSRHDPACTYCSDNQKRFCVNKIPLGNVYTDNVSPEAINYVTGYTAKKLGWINKDESERLDASTGELFTYQPPFQIMSRGGRNGHGLGSRAREHYKSWATYAVNDGVHLSVPRYYKEAYKQQATQLEQEDNQFEKYKKSLVTPQLTQSQLQQKEDLHATRNRLYGSLRKYE